MNLMAENDDSKPEKREKKSRVLLGVILVVFGVVFLLSNYGYASFNIGKLWPLILIIPGIIMILKRS